MNDDIKKIFWTGAAVICVGLFLVSVIKPTYTKVKGLQSQIEAVDYSDTK